MAHIDVETNFFIPNNSDLTCYENVLKRLYMADWCWEG